MIIIHASSFSILRVPEQTSYTIHHLKDTPCGSLPSGRLADLPFGPYRRYCTCWSCTTSKAYCAYFHCPSWRALLLQTSRTAGLFRDPSPQLGRSRTHKLRHSPHTRSSICAPECIAPQQAAPSHQPLILWQLLPGIEQNPALQTPSFPQGSG